MHPAQSPDLGRLGETIRDQRKALGLTQSALAERLGWAQERVSLLETAKYGLPSLPLLAHLAEALELPIRALLEAVGFDMGGVLGRESEADWIQSTMAVEDTPSDETVEQPRRLVADEMLQVVAHDLSNQITSIKGRIDLFLRRLRRGGDERDAADAAAISDSLERLNRMVHDLLDASRLEGGIFSLVYEPTDLVALVRQAVETAAVDQRAVEVRAPGDLIVEADPVRLSQAMVNLVGNAVQHTSTDVPISVRIRRRDDSELAVVEVHDEGPGISAELLPRIFTRHAAGGDAPGLGLGLYLARGIARAHGGDLAVKSVPGAGTTFTLSLPIQRARV